MAFYRSHILVSVDPVCLEKGALDIIDTMNDELIQKGLFDEIQVLETSRIGEPNQYGPDLMVYPEGVHYGGLTVKDIPFLVEEHFLKGRIVTGLQIPEKVHVDEELGPPKQKEVRVVLRNVGKIDPANIEEYIAEDGYSALAKVVGMDPTEVLDMVAKSQLRGRGGAGFPTALKWKLCRQNSPEPRFVICNADEGYPGAFMNRRVLEGDPHAVIEGMAIAAYVIGSAQGYIYIGGGIKDGKGFKAVQTGGPMGGTLTSEHLDLKIDYEALKAAGSMMGSGGLIVMDDETCMVDIARYFMEFTQDESCGKCVPCRIGTHRILDILQRICDGHGKPDDIEQLEYLCREISETSLCGLGQGASNPVVSTLKHFRSEFETHIYEKRCPAKVCRALIHYEIDPSACTGCTICARNCPASAIQGERRSPHHIDPDVCIRCGICSQVCNFNAVNVK